MHLTSQKSHNLSLKRLVSGVLILNLLVAGIVGLSVINTKTHSEEMADITSKNISRILDENISGIIEKVDISLQAVTDEAERQLASGDVQKDALDRFIIRQHSRLPELTSLRVTDITGKAIYGKQTKAAISTSLAHREYFKFLRDTPTAGMVISPPVLGGISGKWMIILARRINRPDGTFAGLVYAGLGIEYLTKYFSEINIGNHGTITLLDKDLTLVARYPESTSGSSFIGSKIGSPQLLTRISTGKTADTYKAASSVDGAVRSFSYRKISKNYPFYIVTGLATVDYLKEWRRDTFKMVLFFALFCAVTIVSTWLLCRELVRARKAEDEVLQSEEKYRILLEESSDSIFNLTSAGYYRYVNKAFSHGVGKPIAEIIGKSLWDVFPKDLADKRFAVLSKVFRSGKIETFEVQIPGVDGVKHFMTTVTPIKNTLGEVISAVCSSKEITQLKNTENALQEAVQSLEIQKHELQHSNETLEQRVAERTAELVQSQKMEAVGQLSGGLAHDFNNVLSIINGYSSLLEMEVDDNDNLKEYVGRIQAASNRAGELTHSLLAFSRTQVMNPQTQNLNIVVFNVATLIKRIIGENIQCHAVITDVTLPVYVDSGQIEQALINLCTNARDAMPDGGTLTISTRLFGMGEPFVSAHNFGTVGQYAVITVTDTGKGIDEATRIKIFEPFFTTKEVGKGTGLGLAMVYGIITQHNGFVDIESETGKGACFTIYLPLAKSEAVSRDLSVAASSEIPSGTETILIVEDDADLLEFMRNMLMKHGYQVITAVDGQDGVDTFRDNADRIQLTIIDMVMPHKSGKEAYKEMLQIKPGAIALFSSGYSAHSIQQKSELGEFAEFIAKPVQPPVLMKKIREMLDLANVRIRSST